MSLPLHRILVCWALASSVAAALSAAEPAGGAAPLQFRRIFAPADRVEHWPLPNVPHVPVEAAEFERLVDLARASESGAPVAVGARLEEAEYEARLEGDALVAGKAKLTIRYEGEAANLLPLEPFSLAATQFQWGGAPPRAAIVGLQPDNQLGVLVERSGVLEMQWTLRGRRDAAQALLFDVRLPDCSTKSLKLNLPADLAPSIEQGVIVSVAEAGAGRRLWQLDLGGAREFHLRLRPEGTIAQPERSSSLRQATTYDFSPRGVEITSQLTLDAPHEPLRSLALRIDPTVRLVSVRQGETELPWSAAAESGETGAAEIEIQFPEPLQGAARGVRLVAFAPLTMNAPWKLPTLAVQNVFWAEGTTKLLLPDPLALREISLSQCRQTNVEPLPAPQEGEMLSVQEFSRSARIELVLGRRPGRVMLRQGTTLDIGASELSARMIADFTIEDSRRYVVNAVVPPQWIVDSVETPAAGQVSDWSVEPIEGHRILSVRLSKALTPQRPLRLVISGRARRSAVERPLEAAECRMLDFSSLAAERELLLLRPAPPYQLQLQGDDKLERLDQASLSAADRGLLDPTWEGLAFAFTPQAAPLRIALQQQPANFSAEVEVKATLLQDALSESYTFRCTPDTARIEKVIVHFAQPREAPLRWTFGGGDEAPMAATRLSVESQTTLGLPPSGESWEVTLRRGRSSAFELRAARTSPLQGATPISLAALPEAASQECTLVVATAQEGGVAIDNRRLEPIPLAPPPARQLSTTRGAYRYEPTRDVLAASEPAVMIAPDRAAAEAAPAWVWQADLDSRAAPDGGTTHLATYQLQNAGRRQVRITLPAASQLQAVWIDDVRAPQGVVGGATPTFLVDLPSGRKFPVLTVHFDRVDPPLGFWGTRAAALPEIDVPVLSSQWTLWLPPGYRANGGSTVGAPTLSWSERLFGPLGRPAGSAAFDPTDAEAWVSLVRAERDGALGREAAQEFLEQLGLLIAAAPRPAQLAWGDAAAQAALEVADRYRNRDAVENPAVLIDRQALAAVGFTPLRELGEGVRGAGARLAAAALEQANLALLVQGRTLVLTTDMTAALFRDQLAPLESGPRYQVLPGPLAASLERDQRVPGSGPLLTASQWAGGATDPAAPWSLHWNPAADLSGWSATRIATPRDGETTVRIVRGSAVRMLGWMAFLLTATLIVWTQTRGAERIAGLLAVSGGLALLLPADLAPLATGVFLGAAGGRVVLSLGGRPRREASQPAPDETQDFVLNPQASLWLAAALLGLSAGTAAAEEPQAAPPIYEVFIPIDAKQQATGEKYQVPEPLFQQLHRRADQVSRQPRGWLLTGATYRGALSLQADLERLAVDELKAVFELQVFSRGRTIRVPLEAGDLTLLPDGAKLDGRPLAVRWDREQKGVEFEVEEPGAYRLSLAVAPVVRSNGLNSGFDLAIPPLANSRLELALPPNFPELQLPTAQGAIAHDPQTGRLTAELGAAERLIVRWPQGNGAGSGPGDAEVEQLLWLRVQPAAVQIDVRWKLKVLSGKVGRLRLQADPRLQILPFAEDSPVLKATSEAGPMQTIVLELKKPLSDQTVLDAQFLLSGSSGVGHLRLPVLNVQGMRTSKRYLAVSIDPALTHEETAADEMASLAVPDFAAALGDARAKPLFAYQLPRSEVDWTLATRPRTPVVEAEEDLFLAFSRSEAELIYETALKPAAGTEFVHRLQAPQALEIDAISVEEEGIERSVRWTRNAADEVSIFLASPLARPGKLSLRGRLPVAEKGEFQTPALELKSARRTLRRVHVFRRSDALVVVHPPQTWTPSPEMFEAPPRADLGRSVGSYVVNGDEQAARIVIQPNQLQVAATMVTTLERGGENWQAAIECRVQVERGVLDRFRLLLPNWWSGPFDVSPSAESELVKLPGQNQQQLVIRPAAAVTGAYRFRVRGAVPIAAGDRLRAPEATLVGMRRLERYLVLPTQSELQQITWESRGLTRAPLPEGFAPPRMPEETYESFRVVGERFHAVPKGVGPMVRSAQIHLADLGVAWNADGTYFGAARFDLAPAGLKSCVVELPGESRIVQATVAGLPALLTPLTKTQVRMTLGPPQLPQRIEILYTGRLAAGATRGRVELPSPVLYHRQRAVPVERTLWTALAPASVGPGAPLRGRPAGAVRLELARLRNFAALLDLDNEAASALSPQQLADWYAPWFARLLRSRQAVFREALTGESPAAASEELLEARSLVRDHDEVARRLRVNEVVTPASAASETLGEAGDLWQWAFEPGREPLRAIYPGAAPKFEVDYPPSSANDLPNRMAGAVLLALLVAGLPLVLRQAGLDLVWRWPHALATAAGLFYWLFLWPSFLGLVLVAVALYLLVRSAWPSTPPASPTNSPSRVESSSWVR